MGVINPMLLSACDLGKVQNFKLLKRNQTVLIYVFMLDLFSFLLYYFFSTEGKVLFLPVFVRGNVKCAICKCRGYN